MEYIASGRGGGGMGEITEMVWGGNRERVENVCMFNLEMSNAFN